MHVFSSCSFCYHAERSAKGVLGPAALCHTRPSAVRVSAWLTAARTPPARRGHIRQYTNAKTSHVPFALDGMYYREFPTMFDWGCTVVTIRYLLAKRSFLATTTIDWSPAQKR